MRPVTFQTLRDHCSDFLSVGACPLLKSLPNRNQSFERVKVRHKSFDPFVARCFNKAFGDLGQNLYSRSVFVNGSNVNNDNVYYVFPVNGYKFLYSKEMSSLNAHCDHVKNNIVTMENHEEIVIDMLKLSYTKDNIQEAAQLGCEIIIFNIPFFYAAQATRPFGEVLKLIENF